MVVPPEVLLLLRMVFDILGFLLFQINLRIALSLLLSEKLSWNFDGDCIESVDRFQQDGHFYYINSANP